MRNQTSRTQLVFWEKTLLLANYSRFQDCIKGIRLKSRIPQNGFKNHKEKKEWLDKHCWPSLRKAGEYKNWGFYIGNIGIEIEKIIRIFHLTEDWYEAVENYIYFSNFEVPNIFGKGNSTEEPKLVLSGESKDSVSIEFYKSTSINDLIDYIKTNKSAIRGLQSRLAGGSVIKISKNRRLERELTWYRLRIGSYKRTYKEIASEYGVSEELVRKAVNRLQVKIKRYFSTDNN